MTQPNPSQDDFTAKLDKILSDPRLQHHRKAVLEAHLTAVREARIEELAVALDAAQNIDSPIGIAAVIYSRIKELKAKEVRE